MINPLNPKIKIEILIYCPYTFSIEVVGRIVFDNDDMESSKRPGWNFQFNNSSMRKRTNDME